MDNIRLGRTGLMVSKSGFGAIPIQRLSSADAKALLRRAYEGGINFFDTARVYTDSEEKIGTALSDVRKNIIIATKTTAKTSAGLFSDLETSLTKLKTDYIDIYQLHDPAFLPDTNHELYQAALMAKQQGKIRFISITYHSLELAKSAVLSKMFDTMQFPISALSSDEDFELVKMCNENDIGFIAMKAMSGGLITDPTATFSLLRSYGNIVPIWGIQHMWELEQFLHLEADPPLLTDELLKVIDKDRLELSGSFCRACGYCVPTCGAGIEMPFAARMSHLLRRLNPSTLVTPEIRAKMEKVKECTGCNVCKAHCPYGLDIPSLIKSEYENYQQYLKDNII